MRLVGSIFILIVAVYDVSISLAEGDDKVLPYDKTISKAQALDIAEATFRYQFNNNASGAQKSAGAYYLKLFNMDPTQEFLDRFKNNNPPVKKGSNFKIDQGIKFYVDKIQRVTDTGFEVSGGYYEGKISASSDIYYVIIKDGKLVVTGSKRLTIS